MCSNGAYTTEGVYTEFISRVYTKKKKIIIIILGRLQSLTIGFNTNKDKTGKGRGRCVFLI